MNRRWAMSLVLTLVVLPTLTGNRAEAFHNWTGQHSHFRDSTTGLYAMDVRSDTNLSATTQTLVQRASANLTFSWNRHTEPIWAFIYQGTGTASPESFGFVTWATLPCLPPGVGPCINGETVTTHSGHVIVGAHTHLNNQRGNWYIGTDAAPSDKIDLWSVITHELGHWIRLGDLAYNVDSHCTGASADATMCSVYPEGVLLGRIMRRQPDTAEDIQSVGLSNFTCESEGAVCRLLS